MSRFKRGFNYIEDDRECDYCDEVGTIASFFDLFDKASIIICHECLKELVKLTGEDDE